MSDAPTWPQPGDQVIVTFTATLVWIDSTGCCGRFERGGEEFNFGAASIRRVEDPA